MKMGANLLQFIFTTWWRSCCCCLWLLHNNNINPVRFFNHQLLLYIICFLFILQITGCVNWVTTQYNVYNVYFPNLPHFISLISTLFRQILFLEAYIVSTYEFYRNFWIMDAAEVEEHLFSLGEPRVSFNFFLFHYIMVFTLFPWALFSDDLLIALGTCWLFTWTF